MLTEAFPTMVTPFNRDGSVDTGAARAMVDWYFENGCGGIFTACQSSEIFFLTEAERALLTKTVVDRAADMGLKVAPGAADRVVAVVGPDARSQVSELGKMREYLGKGASVISAADVAAITSPGVGVEPEVWDVTDAVGSRNTAAALAAVGRFELQSGFAVMMSGVLERFFRQLVDVAAGRTSGMNPYVVKKSQGFLRRWTLQEARVARWRFLTLREQAVSGTTQNADVLLVTTLLRVMRGGRAR